MNIRDSMKQQLVDLRDHLKELSAVDKSELGSKWEGHDGMAEALRRDAVFLDTFIIPDVAAPSIDAPRIATFEPPVRTATFVGSTTPEAAAADEAERVAEDVAPSFLQHATNGGGRK